MSPLPSRTTWRSVALLLVTWLAPLGSASVIHVRAGATGSGNGASWNDAYTSLQVALFSTQPGDEIRVAQGTYKPASVGGHRGVSFVLRPQVSLLGGFAGSGPNPDARDPALYVTILSGDINGNNLYNSHHVVYAADVDATAVLDGFTITAGLANQAAPYEAGAGLYFTNASPQIRSCVIVGNTAGYTTNPVYTVFGRGGGLYIEGGAPLFSDCAIQQNTSRRYGGGVYLLGSNATFENCRVFDNFAGTTQSSYSTDGGGGVFCEQGAPVFRDCDIEANQANSSGAGIRANQCAPTLVRCRVLQNSSEYGNGGGVALDGTQHALLIDCQVESNQSGYYGGGICIVNQSIVEISNCEISFNLGGGTGGGGIYCEESAASLRGCTISGNYANAPSGFGGSAGAGGGIFCQGLDASLTMQNCVVEGNFAGDGETNTPGGNGGGVVARGTAQALIVNCTFRGNRAGTAGYAEFGSGDGGSGGGVSIESGANAQIQGCAFHDNMTGNGSSGRFETGNGGNGGALYVSEATCQVTSSTLAQNETGNGGAGGSRGAGGAAFGPVLYANCVIWANAPNQLAGSLGVRFSAVQGGAAGVGNIASDPHFANSAGDDFRLSWFSPCIDAGENASVPADSLDVDGDGDLTEPTPLDRDGNPRFEDDSGTADTGVGTPPIVDMGAYEFALTSGCADLDGDGVVSIADLSQLLANFGASGTASDGDLNGDGIVDLADLTLLLADFGMNC
jgi:hypothetical protein